MLFAGSRYMQQILSQLKTWLNTGEVQRLVVVVTGVESGETLERWVFGVNASVASVRRRIPPVRVRPTRYSEDENAENAAPAAAKNVTTKVSTFAAPSSF